MGLTYCIPTYNNFALCAKAIDAAMKSTLVPDQVLVKDDSGTAASLPFLGPLMEQYPLSVYVDKNRNGVAGSWNILMAEVGMRLGDYIIISNDDIEIHPHSFQALVDAANATPDQIFFAGASTSGNAFSLFLLRYDAWLNSIGPFDTQFWPAYFEDNDYARRMKLAGYEIVVVDNATYDHVGSATLHNYTPMEQGQHHLQFRDNQVYYVRKWGGMPTQEIYTKPFNIEG